MRRGTAGALAATIAGICLLLAPSTASAHFATIAYSEIVAAPDGDVTWDLYLDPYHVTSIVPLDGNEDGYITADEVEAAGPELAELARESLAVTTSDTSAEPQVGEIALVEAGPLKLREPWRPPAEFPLVHIEAIFELDPADETELAYRLVDRAGVEEHQNIAVATTPATEYLHVFDPDHPELVLDTSDQPEPSTVPIVLAGAGGLTLGGLIVLARRRRPFQRAGPRSGTARED